MDSSTAGDLHSGVHDIAENVEHPRLQTAEAEARQQYLVGDFREKAIPEDASSNSDVSHEPPNLKQVDSKIVKLPDSQEADAAFAHLPEHEKEILKRQLEIPPVKVSYRTLYRYATKWDMIIVGVSVFSAIAGGAIMPLMTVCPYHSASYHVHGTDCGRSSLAISAALSKVFRSIHHPILLFRIECLI